MSKLSIFMSTMLNELVQVKSSSGDESESLLVD